MCGRDKSLLCERCEFPVEIGSSLTVEERKESRDLECVRRCSEGSLDWRCTSNEEVKLLSDILGLKVRCAGARGAVDR